ncbi:MAG: hypothetical protein COV71_01660 [Candidatus Omnitrophica bacterium CG11_big_fil_rev_8_21_14_0_20_41_12]|nr:MAG: hypothetical protein COV71_01660 [Candidatus Omnitrophica bacterium CG11_big_fil_rev_8_21_14_0_20_41_12]
MATQAPEAEAKKVKVKKEKKSNCPVCNKVVKRLKRYYRDGKFYCSKKCWRAFIIKSKAEEKK